MMPARFLERLNSGDVIVLRAGGQAPLRLAVQTILPSRAPAGPSKETRSGKLLRQLIALRKAAKRK